ncbi:MAG: hypothetical protein ABJL55_16420 [Roseibium sp.]
MLTTPLNDPLLTEREGAGADEQEPEPEKPVVTKDTWRRRLRKAHADWPTYAADSPQKTEIEWFRLCDADRDTAVSHLGAYLQHVGGLGRSRICAFSVYLQEKRWQKLPEQADGAASAATMARPFGKLWGAMRFADLVRDPYGQFPRPSPFLQKLLAEGGPQAEQEQLERRARYGWPKVNAMHDHAVRRHKGVTGDPALASLAELFGKVHKGSAIWIAWQKLHRKRGWPWFGDDKDCPDWIWMPDPPHNPGNYAPPGNDAIAFEAVVAALGRFENEHATLTRHEAAQ